MKLIALTIAILVCICSAARSQGAPDEAAVRAVIVHELQGWAKYDPHMVAENSTDDARWLNPFGVELHGSAELEKFLTNLFARPGYRSAKDTSPPKINAIRFESPDVLTVWSDESGKDQLDDRTHKHMAPRHSWYLEILVRRNGVWKIRESIISDEKTP